MNNEVIDRGIIKWQPFNSCFNSEEVIKDLKIKMLVKKFINGGFLLCNSVK